VVGEWALGLCGPRSLRIVSESAGSRWMRRVVTGRVARTVGIAAQCRQVEYLCAQIRKCVPVLSRGARI
jgi:hypothetical protein